MLVAVILLWVAFLLMGVGFIYVLGELNQKVDMVMVVVAETVLKDLQKFNNGVVSISKKGDKGNE